VRVNAAQDAKGAYKLDCTVECYQGEDAPALLAQKIKETKSALTAEGLKVLEAA
jgi:hypothetical protein